MDKEFEGFIAELGKVWSPVIDPPDVGTVPSDVGMMDPTKLAEWLGKCTAWLAYAQSQLGLVEAQKALLSRRFNRIVNEAIVTKQAKQRTYDLQVAEVAKDDKSLLELQENIGKLEAKVALWSRMARAYEAYVKFFTDERERRRRGG